jgi:hypothetical protein
MAENIEYILGIISYNIANFIEFTRRDFDAFLVIYLVILVIAVVVGILMLIGEIIKKGDRCEFKQRRY